MAKKTVNIPDLKGKNILIIGCPASGKTYLSELLAKSKTHTLIHTDDYKEFGFKESLYEILKDVKTSRGNTIVEGVQGYRLLRKGVEYDCYYPDVVIELEVSEQRMIETYLSERPDKDISALKGFVKSHKTILRDYLNMQNDKKPLWIKLKNNY